MLPHEDDHVGDHAHREGAYNGLESLLLPLWQVRGDYLQGDGDGDADQDGDGGAEPDLPQGVLPALLAQERSDDSDD
jgi:hypothetical protein